MKKFTFPLTRVLDWRRTQVQLEESKLERLYAELRAIETRIKDIQAAREQAGRGLTAGVSVTGAELAALDSFQRAAEADRIKLAKSAAASSQAIAAQLRVVIHKRRDVKLLELLHDRRLSAWNAEFGRELDREAGELHLAKLSRSR